MSAVPADLKRFREQTDDMAPAALLRWAAETFSGRITFASSLGAEDQVLTQIIASDSLPIPIFTLDTGRMFGESYQLIAETEESLGVRIKPYFPNASAVEEMVNENGINLFYESVAHRKLCCHVRKVEPLRRALSGMTAWVTGLRRSQSVTRADLAAVEWDEANGLYKINPLIDWSEDQVWEYIREYGVPYNKLHDRGFRSIGCEPCTRAVKAGEDARAGRWWWENPDHKECGLHPEEPTPGAPKVQIPHLKL